MKKMSFFLATALACFVLLSACNQAATDNTADENTLDNLTTLTQDSDRPADSKGKYLIEKGIIEFESEVMGMKQNMTMYIAQYGEKQKVEVKGSFMGIRSHNLNIIKDGYAYDIDLIEKKGTRISTSQIDKTEDIDFTNLTSEIMAELNLKKSGQEEFLGKTCDKYTIDNRAMGMQGTYLVWMGVPLKSEVKLAGINVNMTAKRIDLDTDISDDAFEIPTDIVITELD